MDPGQRSIGVGACYFDPLVPIRQEVWEEGHAGAGVQDSSRLDARDSLLQLRQRVRVLPLSAPLVKRIRYPTAAVRGENIRIFLQKPALKKRQLLFRRLENYSNLKHTTSNLSPNLKKKLWFRTFNPC